MLKSLDALEEGFREVSKKSKEECGDKLEDIRKLILDIQRYFWEAYRECCFPNKKHVLPKYYNSLVGTCFIEQARICGHIVFLSCQGLYRNAFDNIRYALESVVQGLYIDIRHPRADINVKIEILREVESKREYHALRLIDELKIDHKDTLKREYKELSQIIHPSHKQIVATLDDLMKGKGVPVTIDCKEVARIYDSLKKMHDIFFFLFLTYFPEIKKYLKKNPAFINCVKTYNLNLLATVLET